jgi:hypothetical protein
MTLFVWVERLSGGFGRGGCCNMMSLVDILFYSILRCVFFWENDTQHTPISRYGMSCVRPWHS